MDIQVVFIQGGGEDGYKADKPLVVSLQTALGKGYDVQYPELRSDESVPDFGWTEQIGKSISMAHDGIILVGHSLGASMLLKYLSEQPVSKKITGIFLLAAPFWDGNEDCPAGLKLKEGFAGRLPRKMPVFFYQCKDDDTTPFAHLNRYKQTCPQGVFRVQETGGHQFNNDLSVVSKDIQSL